MSLVESIGANSVDLADPAFAICVGAIAILLAALMAPAVLAAVLNVFSGDGGRVRGFLARLLGRSNLSD